VILENKSWILVRPSGTEPLIRCYIESTDKNYFEKMQNYVKDKINELKN
jgi:phosphomannomutase